VLTWTARLREERAASARADRDFTILTAVGVPLTPDIVHQLEDAGVTGLVCAPWMTAEVIEGNFRSTLDVKLAAIDDFAENVIARV
jgi:hypothetical protein